MDKTDISSNISDAIEVIKTMCIPYLQHTTDDNCVICNALRNIVEYYEQPNEPLTIEELKKMQSEPIWTITIGIDKTGRWELIENWKPLYANKEVISLANLDDGTYDCFTDTYGKTWLAYRHKPERT